jgi:NAD(P)-dependent dehydrogenase (short-subunit alcohol dehydrogenase family)
LGSAIAQRFGKAGYRVIGVDRVIDNEAEHIQIDADLAKLTQQSVADELNRKLRRAIGTSDLAGLVNNAAVQQLGHVSSTDARDFLDSFAVNVMAPLLLCQLLLPQLQSASATIFNIGSIHAALTKPGFAPYAVSKSALSGLTRSMALELGDRVRVLEIRPAALATPMLEAGFADDPDGRHQLDEYHPTGRIGNPVEIAETILQLSQTESSFLNGSVINIDGGISHRLHDPA